MRKWRTTCSLAKSPEQTSDLMSRLKFASLKFGNQPFSPRKKTVGSTHELWQLYNENGQPCQDWLVIKDWPETKFLVGKSTQGQAVPTEQPMTVTVNRADCLVCAQAHVHVDVCMWGQVPKENQHTTSPAAGVTLMPDRSAEIQT